MRITLDIPQGLLLEAMRTTHKKTKTDVIVYALEHVIRGEKIKDLKKYRGKVKLDIDLDVLRNRSKLF